MNIIRYKNAVKNCKMFDYMKKWKLEGKINYETIRKHGKKVLTMEPLAKVPVKVEKIFKNYSPEKSSASWALRFAGSLEDVIAVIFVMSNLEQVEDNLQIMFLTL